MSPGQVEMFHVKHSHRHAALEYCFCSAQMDGAHGVCETIIIARAGSAEIRRNAKETRRSVSLDHGASSIHDVTFTYPDSKKPALVCAQISAIPSILAEGPRFLSSRSAFGFPLSACASPPLARRL
jgi:hypothetical protein